MSDCPENCPNRASRRSHRATALAQRASRSQKSVQVGAYLFAFLCSAFLAYQCWSHDRRGEPVSPIVWMPLLLLTGTALGVNIDANKLAGSISGRNE